MKDLSARLEALRKRCGLSYQEIALRSGVSISTVRRIFSGESDLRTILNLRDILKAMDCRWGDLDDESTNKSVQREQAPPIIQVNGISEEEYQERLKPYLQHLDDLTRSRRLLFRCCCVLVIFIVAILVFDIVNPGIGFVRT